MLGFCVRHLFLFLFRLNSRLEETLTMIHVMNATEIIEEIRRLPIEEKGKVIEFIRQLPKEETITAINEPLEEGRSFKNVAELFG